jgi:hypothetical protein
MVERAWQKTSPRLLQDIMPEVRLPAPSPERRRRHPVARLPSPRHDQVIVGQAAHRHASAVLNLDLEAS